jgi:hypothetical protein
MMKREIEQHERESAQAKEIIALLDRDLASINPINASKLKYAREKALSKMPANETVVHRGVLHLLGLHTHHQKLWLTVIGLLLVLGIFLVMHENKQELNQSDAYLLGSELPPETFLNEGFDTWLSEKSQP